MENKKVYNEFDIRRLGTTILMQEMEKDSNLAMTNTSYGCSMNYTTTLTNEGSKEYKKNHIKKTVHCGLLQENWNDPHQFAKVTILDWWEDSKHQQKEEIEVLIPALYEMRCDRETIYTTSLEDLETHRSRRGKSWGMEVKRDYDFTLKVGSPMHLRFWGILMNSRDCKGKQIKWQDLEVSLSRRWVSPRSYEDFESHYEWRDIEIVATYRNKPIVARIDYKG